MASINDFVLRFANVNGSGSASANSLVAKSIYRMGVSIGPKNMFPSNIQGLPTWFEIRVNDKSFTGRRGGVDLMICMNRQTLVEDTKEVEPQGYLLYDSTAHLPDDLKRIDINYLALPVAELTAQQFSHPRQRLLLQNLVYVGALVYLLKLDLEIVKELIALQYKKNTKLVESNYQAIDLGFAYAQEHFGQALPFYIEKRQQAFHEGKILIDGNTASALGCLYAGATVVGWYPITPSTSLVDAFARFCRQYRTDKSSGEKKYAIVQAEDEMTAIGIVMGAFWNGARAFTATSGPGVSLMTEFLGYAYYAEVPAVLFNIQRCGPSTGLPTRTQQADILSCVYASHGDTKHILLFPSSPEDCFTMSLKAFDYAERYQTPVIVMSDLEIGMNEFLISPLKLPEAYQHDRGKILNAEALKQRKKPFFRYLDEDMDGVPYRTLPGESAKGAYFTRGSGHDKYGRYTEDSEAYVENMERLVFKFKEAAKHLPAPLWIQQGDRTHSVLVIYFGSTKEALKEALHTLAQQEAKVVVDELCIFAFPFHPMMSDCFKLYDKLIVVEQNRDGQMRSLLLAELRPFPNANIDSIALYDGMPLTSRVLCEELAKRV